MYPILRENNILRTFEAEIPQNNQGHPASAAK